MRGAGLLLLALAAARPRPHRRLARGGAAWSADEARYSRQLLAFGRDAHARLRRARVLVAGADAVGAEVAKDLALLGVAAVDGVDGGGDGGGGAGGGDGGGRGGGDGGGVGGGDGGSTGGGDGGGDGGSSGGGNGGEDGEPGGMDGGAGGGAAGGGMDGGGEGGTNVMFAVMCGWYSNSEPTLRHRW